MLEKNFWISGVQKALHKSYCRFFLLHHNAKVKLWHVIKRILSVSKGMWYRGYWVSRKTCNTEDTECLGRHVIQRILSVSEDMWYTGYWCLERHVIQRILSVSKDMWYREYWVSGKTCDTEDTECLERRDTEDTECLERHVIQRILSVSEDMWYRGYWVSRKTWG